MNKFRFASLISSRFNDVRYLQRSIIAMRVIAIIGIATAVAALLISLSVASGFRKAYKSSILDFNAHIVILKSGEFDNPDEIIKDLDNLVKPADGDEKVNKSSLSKIKTNLLRIYSELLHKPVETEKPIIGITKFLYKEALIIHHGKIKGIVIKGVDPDTMGTVNNMRLEFVKDVSSLNKDKKVFKIMLGKALAKDIGVIDKDDVFLGGEPHLMVAQDEKKQETILVKIAGLFESGLYDYDANFVLMNIDDLQRLFKTQHINATGIEIKLDDPDKAESVAGIIEDQLPSLYDTVTWGELNKDLFDALRLEKMLFTIIMGIFVVVAAFNIIGVIILLVYQRTHEIGILKALGVNGSVLKKIFSNGGVRLGLIGTVLGIFIATVSIFIIIRFNFIKLDPEIYFIDTLPVDISWALCAMVVVFCIIICWLVSRLASNKVTELQISEILGKRY